MYLKERRVPCSLLSLSLSLPPHPLPSLPPPSSLLPPRFSHLYPGGIIHSTEDQLRVSPRGGGGSGMAAGDSSTLAPGSGLLNVSKSHKRSRSEGTIHNVNTERYMVLSTCTCMYSACTCTCKIFNIMRVYKPSIIMCVHYHVVHVDLSLRVQVLVTEL
jgi:hypothetical protein